MYNALVSQMHWNMGHCIYSIMLIFLSVKLASEIYQCVAGGVFLASPIEECVPSASSLPKVLTSGPVSL